MICPKCHTNIEKNSTYCKFCGSRIRNEKYLKSFLGNKYNDESFSIPASLFGALYLLSKKLILQGLLLILLLLLIGYYNTQIALFLCIIIHIILGYQFNKKYQEYAKQRTAEIMIENQRKSKEVIIKKCQKAGKKSFFPVLAPIGMILTIIILSNNHINQIETNIAKQKRNSTNELYYKIPKELREGKRNTNTYHHVYYYDQDNHCSITIINIPNQNLENYKNTYIKKNQSTEQKIEKINNQLWEKELSFTKNEITVNLLTTHNNNLYHIQYSYQGEKCKGFIQIFGTSLLIK